MALVINAPEVERQIEIEAAKHGVSTEQYATDILASHVSPLPKSGNDSIGYRLSRLDALIASNDSRDALPASAFDRESIYSDDVQ